MRAEANKIICDDNGLPTEKWDQSVMRLNTKRLRIVSNIRNNIRRQLPQLQPCLNNPQRIAIIGGGWSLDDTFEELRSLYFDGVKLIAVNGSGRWLMERNMRPSVLIMLDARPENAEFVAEPIPHCSYYFASQIDPSILDLCKDRDVTLFHGVSDGSDLEIKRLDHFYGEGHWLRVPTAGTVGVTAIMIMRFLGFMHQHLFGFDSCYDPKIKGRHHAYSQTLNDGEGTATFRIADKDFECAPWQASQLQSFMNVMRINGEALDLTIHGEGMLAHVLKYGCDLAAHELTKE